MANWAGFVPPAWRLYRIRLSAVGRVDICCRNAVFVTLAVVTVWPFPAPVPPARIAVK
jgi:hypothetical protein